MNICISVCVQQRQNDGAASISNKVLFVGGGQRVRPQTDEMKTTQCILFTRPLTKIYYSFKEKQNLLKLVPSVLLKYISNEVLHNIEKKESV